MTPLERAARKVAEDAYDRLYSGLDTEPPRDQFVDIMTASHLSTVRLVLNEFREPSEKMLEDAATVDLSNNPQAGGREYWTAMIEAALKEVP